ncbi:MAG: hypothetical protein H7Y00_05340, partial [Fimbriimonadaceae bacterium]|nr:hypothetical protein [Chitinophagales bacterium]
MAYQKFALLIRVVAVLCILLGLSVIAGWLLHIQILKNVTPALPSMKFNSAICFLLSGSAFLFILSEKKEYIITAKILSIITFILSAISFSQDIFSYKAGIDELFVKDADISSFAGASGRMAATTAFSFMIIGLAFYRIRSNNIRQKIFAQYALHFVSAIALLAIIGYLYNVPGLYTLSFLSSMALHTSVFLFLLSVAASYINYSLGITGLFTGDKTGNAMARKLFPLSALLLVLLSFLRMEMNRYNLVTADLSIALFALAFLFVSLLLISITAKQLNKIDLLRYNTQENLKTVNANLEKTIAERTALLKHTSDTLQLAATAASIGIWEIDLNTGIIQGNNILHNILEIDGTEKQITTAQMQHLVHPEDRRLALQNFHLAQSGEKELDF